MALRHLATAVFLCSALACSKSSDSTPPPSTCGTHAPVATAGASPSSVEPVVGTVTLTASSTDADDACLPAPEARTYLWNVYARPAGSGAFVAAPTAAATTFTPDVPGTYQLEVVATDAAGHESLPAFATVTASACSLLAPTIVLPATASGSLFNPVALPAPTVTDPNCLSDGTFTYQWTITSRPPGGSAVVATPTAAATSFTPDAVGTWQVALVVRNSRGLASEPAYLTVNVATCGSAVPALPALVAAPTAPNAGDLVTLGLAGPISDPNAVGCGMHVLPYHYRWTMISKPAGSTATLAGDDTGAPAFVPDVPGGVFQVALTVTDALGNVSAPAFLAVTSTLCGAFPPVVLLSGPPGVNGNWPAAITAAVTDADNGCPGFSTGIVDVAWSVVGQPLGAHPVLAASSTGPAPAFTASNTFQGDVPGTYTVRAVATASNGRRSAPADLPIVVSACGTAAPVVTQVQAVQVGAGQTPTGAPLSRPPVGTAVALVATSYDADAVAGGTCGTTPDTQPPTYRWALVSVPAGSLVPAPVGVAGNTLVFTPDVAGTFVFAVTAVDDRGLASAPVTITVPTGTCGPTVAGVVGTPSTPVIGQVVTATVVLGGDTCVAGAGAPSLSWSMASRPAGSSAFLSGSTTAAPTFVPDVPGGYVLQVVVTDVGGFSTVATTEVTAGGCTSAPTIAALTPGQVFTATEPTGVPSPVLYRDDTVRLGLPPGAVTPGSCSAATSTSYTYQWALVSRPAGSQAQLSLPTTAAPAFVADVSGGTYQVMVVVTDSNGNASAPALFTLPTVSDCGARSPVAAFTISNATPDAYAATALLALPVSDPSQLSPLCPVRFWNVAGSYAYAWSVRGQPPGSHPSISPPSGASAAFQADAAGGYVVQLAVTGWDGVTGTAQQFINVSACGTNPPVASAFTATQASVGLATSSTLVGGLWTAATPIDTSVTATLGATVVDADNLAACGFLGQAVAYAWSIVTAPVGSTATLWNPTSTAPALTPDVPGPYQVQLRTTDPLGNASTAAFQLVAGPCGAQAPAVSGLTAFQPGSGITVTTGGTQPQVLVGGAIGLSATASDPDTLPGCGLVQNLQYAWTLVQAPPGSLAQLVRASTATPSFTPDVASATPYVVSLVVTDDQGHASAPAAIAITAR